MSKVTINIVAKHAGVSKKTVSRVLNEEPNVKQSTKEKVKAVFEELGYRPSQQARGLARNQSFLIGLIYDNPNKSYVSEVQNGALSVCDEKGFHLIIHPAAHESEHLLENVRKLWVESRLDGLILTPPFSDMMPLLELLDSLQATYVRIGATQMQLTKPELNSQAPCVFSNDEEMAYKVTRYLISLGHNEIGFVKGHVDHPVSALRFNGFQRALSENGIPLKQKFVVEGVFDFASGEDAGRKLLSLDERPTAIFASNDYMAAGILKVASQRKISVPHDLSVVGFDNAPISEYIWPSLTTVKQPIFQMAAKATQLLLQKCQSGLFDNEFAEATAKQLISELVIRESSAPLKQN